MAKIESVTFSSTGSDSVPLEGMFHIVKGVGQWPAAVICHPHPLGGGTMHNGVVRAIAQALAASGVLALRFNFRGVEQSGGQYDHGRGEQDDVAGAFNWLLKQPEVDPWRVSVVGYSFGAWVGLSYAQTDPRVVAVATAGLVAWRDNIDLHRFDPKETRRFDPEFLASFTRPKLFVSAEHDAFTPPAAIRALVDGIPPPKTLHIVAGTDHFFQGREQEVGKLVAEFITTL
jgi:alpha/beta superfamily hydrolase